MNKSMVISFIIWFIVIFCIGFSCGNVRVNEKAVDLSLEGAKELFIAQGDKPEQIEATLKVMRASKLSELGAVKRQYLSIYLPSILIVINIVLTIVYKRKG